MFCCENLSGYYGVEIRLLRNLRKTHNKNRSRLVKVSSNLSVYTLFEVISRFDDFIEQNIFISIEYIYEYKQMLKCPNAVKDFLPLTWNRSAIDIARNIFVEFEVRWGNSRLHKIKLRAIETLLFSHAVSVQRAEHRLTRFPICLANFSIFFFKSNF